MEYTALCSAVYKIRHLKAFSIYTARLQIGQIHYKNEIHLIYIKFFTIFIQMAKKLYK
jgi:hypothetical protein